MAGAVEWVNVGYRVTNKNGEKWLLEDVSGIMPKGQIITVIGPSGSGKSTLLSLCNHLITPSAGDILIEGRGIRQWPVRDLRRYVGMVSQSPVIFSGTVKENLAMGLSLHGRILEEPEKPLAAVGLSPDLLEQDAKSLSGGQQQRVALARVIVNQPQIILLDEVTAALDRGSSGTVENWMRQLNSDDKITIVWVTHDLGQARRMGDVTWFMEDGRLVEWGATRDVFSQPKTARMQQYVGTEGNG